MRPHQMIDPARFFVVRAPAGSSIKPLYLQCDPAVSHVLGGIVTQDLERPYFFRWDPPASLMKGISKHVITDRENSSFPVSDKLLFSKKKNSQSKPQFSICSSLFSIIHLKINSSTIFTCPITTARIDYRYSPSPAVFRLQFIQQFALDPQAW